MSIANRLLEFASRLRELNQGITCDQCQTDQTLEAIKHGYRVPKCDEAVFKCSTCQHHIKLRKITNGIWVNDVIKFSPDKRESIPQRQVKRSLFAPARIGFRRD